jgi:hypothetical protein
MAQRIASRDIEQAARELLASMERTRDNLWGEGLEELGFVSLD